MEKLKSKNKALSNLKNEHDQFESLKLKFEAKSRELEEKDKKIMDLKEEIEALKEEALKYRSERNRIEIERNRLEVSLRKTALGIDIVDFDNKKLIDENRMLSQRINTHQKETVDEITNRGIGTPGFGNCGNGKEQCIIF